jgi:hypothetical protein
MLYVSILVSIYLSQPQELTFTEIDRYSQSLKQR